MKIILAITALLLSSGAVMAQREPLAPAPVPNLDSGRPAPADRAGRSDAADNSAPFSAAPTGQVAGSGQATPQTLSSSPHGLRTHALFVPLRQIAVRRKRSSG